MTIRIGSSGRRALQSLVLWLGLIALSIQGLVPLCASAASGNSIVICTVHGYETISVDADGNPAQPAPATDHANCFMCLGCQLAAGFIAPSLVAYAAPTRTVQPAPETADAGLFSSPAHRPYASRAPPSAPETLAV